MESTKPEEKQDEGKITGKGCLGCLGIGAGILLLLAFLGSLLPDDLDSPAQAPPVDETSAPTVSFLPEVESSRPPAPPQPANEQLDEDAQAEFSQMMLDLTEVFNEQGEITRLATPHLQENCDWRSFNEEACRLLLGSSLSLSKVCLQINEIARGRIRTYQAEGRDLGVAISEPLGILSQRDQNCRRLENSTLELARQFELEREVRTLGNGYRDAPMYKSFAQRWDR